MATKAKTRSGGKSPTSLLSAGSQGHGRRSAKFKDNKTANNKQSLAFKVLQADDTKKVAEFQDVLDVEKSMLEILQMTNHSVDLKDDAILDYYVSACWWAKQQGYSNEQLSAFYTVIHTLLDNLKEKQLSLAENLKEFHRLLAGIGQDLSGSSSGGLESLFDITQAKSISEYVYVSFFQHYKLFEFMTSHLQAEEILGTDLEIELPLPSAFPWPPPLDEGIPEQVFIEHNSPPEQETESATGGEDAAADEAAKGDEAAADGTLSLDENEDSIISRLSPEEIETIIKQMFDEMLGGLENDIAAKLREKENAFINQINKIHIKAED